MLDYLRAWGYSLISKSGQPNRVVSGMRPTGRLHLGHYHGVLKNWIEMQYEYDCYFFVADWHALATHYESETDNISDNVWEMVIDWLAAGVDPGRATLFVQSQVPQHAELNLLLSMITPLGWLERVPSYKDQQDKLNKKDLSTHGFLGYPVLQAADIMLYQGIKVPVGKDQVPHVELTREIARRFNYLYGRESGFEERVEAAIGKLGKKGAKLYYRLKTAYTERGEQEAIERSHALLSSSQNLTSAESELLHGYIEGGGRVILQEPEALLTKASKVSGLDGNKMSKSYGNTIALRDDRDRVERELRAMPTDPARVRRSDPGDPNRCPVWDLHQIYTDQSTKDWVEEGCRTAGIGCIDCKQPLIDAILKEQKEIAQRADEYSQDPTWVKNIIADGCERAREAAEETMEAVRRAMSLDY